MTASTAYRVLADWVTRDGFRERYWDAHRSLSRLRRLVSRSHRSFASTILKSQVDFMLSRVHPVPFQLRERMRAAVTWLLRAQDATLDDGVSYGYFPCDGAGTGWLPSYPETTGYIIPSLLDYADLVGDPTIPPRAQRMAIWETRIQMPSGAVQAGPACPPEQQRPSAFNTGMVLHGYVALLLRHENDPLLGAARRAAEFLVGDMGEDGHFRTHGPFVTHHRVKTYASLCAWPLYRFGQLVGERRYLDAALRAVQAAVAEQAANGWFAHNCLDRPEAPLTHTIGYTMQGILEVGLLAGREDLVAAVERAARPLMMRIAPDGFLHGRFYADWHPACFSSCLAGSAQIAVVLYRLFEHGGDPGYRDAADRLVDFLKGLQIIDSSDLNVTGGLPGSFPMLGEYMPGGYPDWATKYFLDALMLQEHAHKVR